MFRTSTSALLVAVQSVMLTGLILAAGTLALQAWQKYDLAVEIEESAILNRALLDGMLAVRLQISEGQTALTALSMLRVSRWAAMRCSSGPVSKAPPPAKSSAVSPPSVRRSIWLPVATTSPAASTSCTPGIS